MASGIQAAQSGVATLNYTPATNAKVRAAINGSAAASVAINGVAGIATNSVLSLVDTFVAAGQTFTLTTVASSTAIVSSIEE
jgi:hypothetical protein